MPVEVAASNCSGMLEQKPAILFLALRSVNSIFWRGVFFPSVSLATHFLFFSFLVCYFSCVRCHFLFSSFPRSIHTILLSLCCCLLVLSHSVFHCLSLHHVFFLVSAQSTSVPIQRALQNGTLRHVEHRTQSRAQLTDKTTTHVASLMQRSQAGFVAFVCIT